MFNSNALATKGGVLCYGELLWDGVMGQRFPGGAPGNVASHLIQHGVRTHVCSAIGSDSLGDELLEELNRRGFDTGLIQKTAAPTIVTNAISDKPKVGPSLTEEASFGNIEYEEAAFETAKGSSIVYFGTAIQYYPTARSTLYRLLDRIEADETLLVADSNLRWQRYSLETVQKTLHYVDVLKLTVDEAQKIATLLDLRFQETADIIRWLKDTYAIPTIAVTDGKRGSYLYHRFDDVIHVPGVFTKQPDPDADPLGAGDAFVAGMLISVLEQVPNIDWIRALHYGNVLGSYTAASRGAMPEYRVDDIRALA